MDITAYFEDADAAEAALVNLQSLGIFPQRYKMRARHMSGGTGGFFVPAAEGVGNITTNAPGTTPVALGIPAFLSPDAAFLGAEEPSREVILQVTVDDAISAKTQSALISNHGRNVRQV